MVELPREGVTSYSFAAGWGCIFHDWVDFSEVTFLLERGHMFSEYWG